MGLNELCVFHLSNGIESFLNELCVSPKRWRSQGGADHMCRGQRRGPGPEKIKAGHGSCDTAF